MTRMGKACSNRMASAKDFVRPDMRRASEEAARVVLDEVFRFRDELRKGDRIEANERAITETIVLHLNGRREEYCQSFVFQSESMENRASGSSPAVDIGVFWRLPGRSSTQWSRVSAIEAKRLDASLPHRRRREYVVGHEHDGRYVSCGGMERYKQGIHGSELKNTVMLLGYIQSDDALTWWKRIGNWIAELTQEPERVPAWTAEEQLKSISTKRGVSVCESVVMRAEDSIGVFHLWIDLVDWI